MSATRIMMASQRWLFAVSCFFAVQWAGTAEGQPVRVGVVLPLSGPLAAEGRSALDEIRKVLGRGGQIELVVVDDQSSTSAATEQAHRLVEKAVSVVIGPLTSAATAAIAPTVSARRIPVISLAAPSRARLAAIQERGQTVYMFAPVSARYLEATGKLVNKVGKGRVSFVYFNPAATDYIDEIAPLINRYSGGFETQLKAPVGSPSDVERFAAYMSSKSRSLVVGMVFEAAADALSTKSVPEISAPMLLFTPPPSFVKAGIAASLVADAVRAGASGPDAIRYQVQKSPLYGQRSRTLELEWTVISVNMGPEKDDIRAAFGGGLGDVTPCSCNSRDGRVSKLRNCRRGDRCELHEQRDTCEVRCQPNLR